MNPIVRMVALCDVDSKVLNAGVEASQKKNEPVEGYADAARRAVEEKDIPGAQAWFEVFVANRRQVLRAHRPPSAKKRRGAGTQ